MKQGDYEGRNRQEKIYLQKCNINFSELSFNELGEIILLIVEAKRQIIDLAKKADCQIYFADDLFIELALYKRQSHYDLIKLAEVAQFDYNMTLDAFASWIAMNQGFEVVEG